jgi:minor extracellular serine protease Vpr
VRFTPFRRVVTPVGVVVCAGLFWAVSALSAPATHSDKIDYRLQALLNQSGAARSASPGVPDLSGDSGREMVEVLVRGDLDRGLLKGLGAVPQTLLPGFATARVPLAALPALAGSDRVSRIQAGTGMKYLLDKNKVETDVESMWGGEPPQYPSGGFTGQGVVVGIVDTGIDRNHLDFRNADGTTRIKYMWDHTGGPEPPPAGYTYGQEWTAAEINAGVCLEQDLSGHGTHISGVAVGNGRATGNGMPQFTYVGMAPEADIIVVKLDFPSDVEVIDGVSYIFQKASQLGEDAVVLLAVGKQSGAHDGTDALDQAIDAMTGPGRIVVAAAGNEGLNKIHSAVTLTRHQTSTTTFTVPSYGFASNPFILVDGWVDQGSTMSVTVVTPSGYSLGPIAVGQVNVWNNSDGSIRLDVPQATPGQAHLSVTNPGAGTWTVRVDAGNSSSGTMDFWISDYDLAGTTPQMVQGQSFDKCVASPATANNVIAVGAYTTKKYWTDQYGGTKFYISAVMDQIADFSSRGPRRDGVLKPDITGSGYGVASARSTAATIYSGYVVQDGVHCMMYGTSIAAASVAGAVALLLEEFPGLDPPSAMTLLQGRAKVDSYTGTVPNATWGWGKVCMTPTTSTGVGETKPGTGLRPRMLGAPYPNPTGAMTRVPVNLDVAGDVTVSVYDVAGREVKELYSGAMEAGPHLLNWDGTNRLSQPVPSGSYYVVAVNHTARESRAVLIVR